MRRLLLEVLARTPVDRRGARLVGGNPDGGDLRVVGTPEVHELSAFVDDSGDRMHTALAALRRNGTRDLPSEHEGHRRHLGGAERRSGCRDRHRLVLVGRLAASADGADDLTVDDERYATREGSRAVERERAEPAAGHLRLDVATWP